jgi:hypothetical protein
MILPSMILPFPNLQLSTFNLQLFPPHFLGCDSAALCSSASLRLSLPVHAPFSSALKSVVWLSVFFLCSAKKACNNARHSGSRTPPVISHR